MSTTLPKKHVLVLVSTTLGAWKEPPRVENLFYTRDEDEIAYLRDYLKNREEYFESQKYAKNARQVVVTGVGADYDNYASKADKFSGRVAKPVSPGQKFPSAIAASRHIGVDYNVVAQELASEMSKHSNEATVRGVTFRYLDTVRV